MPIRLEEHDEKLADLCRTAEHACAGVAGEHVWPVLLPEDFGSLPQVQLRSQARTPAAFVPSAQTIYVNETPFFGMAEAEQVAVLVHEVGHAVLESASCFEADMFACRHGQEEALVAERRKHYGAIAGDEYAAALLQWREPDRARAAFSRWHGRRLAGVI